MKPFACLAGAVLLALPAVAHAQNVCEYRGKFPPACGAPRERPAIVPMTLDPATVTPEAMIPAIRQGFAQHDCSLAMEGGEEALAQTLGQILGVTAEAVLDRDGPWYRPVDNAIDQLGDQGQVIIDRSAGVIRFPNCAG